MFRELINNIIKFSESTINIKPEADINIRINASVVLLSISSEVFQNELKVKSNINAIRVLPIRENGSERIIFEK